MTDHGESGAGQALKAVLLLLTAILCFDVMSLLVRILSAHYAPPELSAYRNVLGIVPSLALLGLIENAIKHGIAPSPSGGLLQIRAELTGAQWFLEVRNDCPIGAGRPGTRTGLANLRERLELGYGDRAQLQIEHNEGRHLARLCLPVQT